MAGYFDYIGRVITEKGSWYKILMVTLLQGLIILFNPKVMFQQLANGELSGPNIPGIVLYGLASMLIFGFAIQIYNYSMNNKPQLLPDIDFFDMFVKALKLIPFQFVWVIYIGLFVVLLSMAMAPLYGQNPFIFGIVMALLGLVFLFFVLMIAALFVIFSKSFSYKYVLNPLTPFRVFPRVWGPMVLLLILYCIIEVILYGLLFGGAILLGVSGGESSLSTMVAFGILLLIFGYMNNLCSFAYNLRLADVVKTRLADTEYLDDDYDTPVPAENDDELDY